MLLYVCRLPSFVMISIIRLSVLISILIATSAVVCQGDRSHLDIESIADLEALDPALLVQFQDGSVYGQYTEWAGATARSWMGIPYGSPPNGTQRYQPPSPTEPWSQLLDASVAGPGCPQVCSLPPGSCPPVQSEDCLFLNVFAPAVTPQTLLPVMVFIHGGNFRQGSGATSLYDGTVMVNTSEVILVTINYRLGSLGFFFNNESTANNGMLDQQLALQWVNTNIEAFLGDKTQITIFGQSAGATSIGLHLQNEVSNKLFQRAILESLPLGIPVRFPDEAEAINAIFAGILNCNPQDLACLQAASVKDILAAAAKAAGEFGPDHHFLEVTQAWEPTIQMDSFNVALPTTDFFQQYSSNIPIIIGSTSQEAYLFIYEGSHSPMSSLAALGLETVIFGLDALIPLGDLYPLNTTTGADNRGQISILASDELFVCPVRNATDAIRSYTPNVYTYSFDHVAAASSSGWGPNYQICWTHVCHGSDLPFVFGSVAACGWAFQPDELILSQQIQTYWTNFAKSGNPNGPLPVDLEWPSLTSQRETMHFQTGELEIIENTRGTECDYLDTLGYTL